MANKSSREQRVKQNRRKIFEQLCEKLKIFYYIALGISVLLLLTYFFKWVYVYNDGSTTPYTALTEVKVNGWSFFAAAISGSYTQPDAIFGDIAVPFYMYAQSYVETLGVLTIVSIILILAVIAVQIVALVTKKHVLSWAAIALEVLLFIVLLASYIVALMMKNGQILSVYCGGNTACSIRSLIIIPLIVSVALLAVNIVAVAKYYSARKYLR